VISIAKFVCFDKNGTKLTDADSCDLTYDATYGFYRGGSDRTTARNEQEIAFGEDVATVILGITSGTYAARFRGIEYYIIGQAEISVIHDAGLIRIINSL